MGGVGIAYPQDAISAVFSNPAGMCFGPFCPGSEFNFAGTLFMPHPEAEITLGAVPPNPSFPGGLPAATVEVESDEKVYAIPAIGVSVPITNTFPLWRFGIAAFGVTGLGVDYRESAMDTAYDTFLGFPAGSFPGSPPLVAGEFTQLQIMRFAPSIAFQPTEMFSLGLAVHIDYSSLDLREGSAFNYGVGVQAGALFKPFESLYLGATYISPRNVDHENVADLDGDGSADDLELESPQEVGLGIAFEPIAGMFLIEVDGKWINWSDANGYGDSDFDWDDQFVIAVGAQLKPTKKLALRVGYNYAENPVNEHSPFVGATPAGPTFTTVQGKTMPTYFYETFRIVGFPAIVEHHVTAGIGYEFSNKFAMTLGYMHAFENEVTENGTTLIGQPVTIESSLDEDSLEFGFTWRF
jgi:long-chain fatty acid transport protein